MIQLFLKGVVNMDVKRGIVDLKNPSKANETSRQFTFDAVYDWKYVKNRRQYWFLIHSEFNQIN